MTLKTIRRYAAGEVPLKQAFLHDMLLIGTMVNIGIAFVAMFLLASELPSWIGLAVFFSPQPYNIILALGVWRSAARDHTRWRTIAQTGTLVWFPLMLVI